MFSSSFTDFLGSLADFIYSTGCDESASPPFRNGSNAIYRLSVNSFI